MWQRPFKVLNSRHSSVVEQLIRNQQVFGSSPNAGSSELLSQIMQLASLPEVQGEGTQTYYGHSSARQRSKFGEIASPLWLQMPNVSAVGNCHYLGEYFLALY